MTEHFYGTTITIATNTIEEVLSISGPNIKVDYTETSHSASTEQWRTYFPTWKDGGEVSVKCNLDHDLPYQDSVLDAITAASQAAAAFVITWPDASTYAFSGIVTEWTPTGDVGADKLEVDFKIKVSGKVTYTQ